ncbi:MAG TPA: TetR/AcrR family transcriptional regulator [Terriglobales bacterium]|jgi:TetR/AcrR family transcriptional repressor of nem operon|nr:TetR/AcrR family transcriptional regulator [Terriglobales bacterium]
MRYEPDHKVRTHRRIVRNASRQLRAKGLNGPAVTTLMKASGLTHGGFYRHFGSRDELVVEAIEESLQELRDRLLAAAKQAEPGEGWKAMVRSYLSLELCDRPDEGCPLAALAPDMARTRPALKQRISAAILEFREELMPFMPGRNPEEKAVNFLAIFSSMVGAIAIARTMPDATVRQKILNIARDHLLQSF